MPAAGEIRIPELDLSRPRRIHVVGVGGAGMSAVALLLARMGHRVSGCDMKELPALARLTAAGVDVRIGNDVGHVELGAEVYVYSTAVPPTLPELRAARERGMLVLHRAAALAALATTARTVAVAGSHGKTTTASMLALVLREAGWDPSFLIGGDVNEVGTNAAYGAGDWLVLEADESDGTFLHLAPQAAIVTNVEPDHLDHYGSFDALVAAFETFVDGVEGPVVTSADDPVAAAIARARPHVRTIGVHEGAAYRITDYRASATGCRFGVWCDGRALGTVTVPLGVRTATNAAAAIAMALELGAGFDAARRALQRFGGVARRFQYRGARAGVAFVDDYAHLPGEVAAAIEAAREGGWERVVAVFQPHRYSRTAALWQDFADAFSGAAAVVVTDVYGAGEQPVPGVSGRLVVEAVRARHPDLPVHYVPSRTELAAVPARYAQPGDLVLSLGAGDLTAMPDVWLSEAAP